MNPDSSAVKTFFQQILEQPVSPLSSFNLEVQHLLIVLAFFLVMRVVLIYLRRAIIRYVPTENKSAENRKSAITQIVAYIVYLVFMLGSLQYVGVNLSLVMASAAALMVGLGFGLQQIFNDLISGLIMLFEGNVNSGDIIDVNDKMGKVDVIGLRATTILTHENTTIVVPNSQLVSDRVHNYAHGRFMSRFQVNVGVAYGSDVPLVQEVLMTIALGHQEVSGKEVPFVRFVDFGESSLDFELHFWSENVWNVDNIMSDIRYAIDAEFRAHDVTIPFPQRDLHIVSSQVKMG